MSAKRHARNPNCTNLDVFITSVKVTAAAEQVLARDWEDGYLQREWAALVEDCVKTNAWGTPGGVEELPSPAGIAEFPTIPREDLPPPKKIDFGGAEGKSQGGGRAVEKQQRSSSTTTTTTNTTTSTTLEKKQSGGMNVATILAIAVAVVAVGYFMM